MASAKSSSTPTRYERIVRLTLVPGRDDDLIEIIQNIPKGMIASRLAQMLRHGIRKEQTAQADDAAPVQVDDGGFDL
jgi:hypothetical protein